MFGVERSMLDVFPFPCMSTPPKRPRGRPRKQPKPSRSARTSPAPIAPPTVITRLILVRWHHLIRYWSEMRQDANPRKKYLGARALGRKFEVTVNTIRKDIATLRDQYRMPLEECPEYGGGW